MKFDVGSNRDSERFVRGTLCHPEAKPTDLATEWEVSLIRRPDPSLRCAPFRMTDRAQELMQVRTRGGRLPIVRNKANFGESGLDRRTKCAKQSPTRANWGIWGTTRGGAGCAKQSQFPRRAGGPCTSPGRSVRNKANLRPWRIGGASPTLHWVQLRQTKPIPSGRGAIWSVGRVNVRNRANSRPSGQLHGVGRRPYTPAAVLAVGQVGRQLTLATRKGTLPIGGWIAKSLNSLCSWRSVWKPCLNRF